MLVPRQIPASIRWERQQILPVQHKDTNSIKQCTNYRREQNLEEFSCPREENKISEEQHPSIWNKQTPEPKENSTEKMKDKQKRKTKLCHECNTNYKIIIKKMIYFLDITSVSPPLRCSNFHLVHFSPFLCPHYRNIEWEQGPIEFISVI